ncbi:PepSY domain-containing protein [Sphingosinicella soli]|uniref:Putative membrane protein YkoI n=1 Tax=Sphingosinicella soli TaxID=333708 RepID=A0A7W7B373_9SPHN|nr:PepSY domain-containing protein [Sphingosinicella soli]MBB4633189.1 putative membrane protein YkoI [Sphingosinicella soli]
MKFRIAFVWVVLCVSAATAAPAQALDPKMKDHDAARAAAKSGEIRSLGEIKNRVRNRVQGELVGSKFDMHQKRYRLRYLREGSIVEVDVDAKTGKIIDIDGN